MKTRFCRGAFFLCLVVFGRAHAAETDNFYGRHKELAQLLDSGPLLDREANRRLEIAVEEANEQVSCDEHQLYLKVWKQVGKNPIGEFEKFAEELPAQYSFLDSFKDGIYGAVPTFLTRKDSPAFADLFLMSGWYSPTLRVYNHIIGADKFGHFFGQGWDYFRAGNLAEALNKGEDAELHLDGYIGSGVYSYADLSANFDGLKFWRSLLGGDAPYVRCEQSKFRKSRDFTWKEYVASAWDEALNCSKYVSKSMTDAVLQRQRELGVECPAEPRACQEMVRRPCAQATVSQECFILAGVDESKAEQACVELEINQDWSEDVARAKIDSTDQFYFTFDALIGIALMPFHFVARDIRSIF